VATPKANRSDELSRRDLLDNRFHPFAGERRAQAFQGRSQVFLHDDRVSTLLKAGLAHAQFETIHPFLDGNGRVGRMLITLVLVANGALSNAWLYMSLHFKRHRSTYYE
jgi:Fic family protein